MNPYRTIVAAASLLALTTAANAEDAHHPPAGATAPPAPSGGTTSSPAPGGMGMMGMMMGRGGAMAGSAAVPMMMMGMGGQGMAGPGMMVERVEGRIAFLRAEIKITDQQGAAWNQYAEALRSNAKTLAAARGAAPAADAAPPTLAQRLEREERWLAARLEGTRAIRAAFGGLLPLLSDEQRKTVDDLMPMHVGLGAHGAM